METPNQLTTTCIVKAGNGAFFSTISANIKCVLLCNLTTRVNRVCIDFIHGMNFHTAIVTGGK